MNIFNICFYGKLLLYGMLFIFFLRTFIGPYYTIILGFLLRYNIPTATLRLPHLVQHPLPLVFDGFDWDPQEHLV